MIKILVYHRNALCLETVLSPVMFILYCTFVTKVCAMMLLVTIVWSSFLNQTITKKMMICNFLQVDDFFIIAMMLFVTSYQMFLVFSFSMLGTELTEAVISLNKLCTMTFFEAFPISQQSSAISEAIYQCGWTERTPSEQKLLMFVQMRSQRRVAITVWKFFALGRASFSVVFNV